MNNDVTEIKDKLIAYANSLDAREWSALKDIFHILNIWIFNIIGNLIFYSIG